MVIVSCRMIAGEAIALALVNAMLLRSLRAVASCAAIGIDVLVDYHH